jgi:hypothetical protein
MVLFSATKIFVSVAIAEKILPFIFLAAIFFEFSVVKKLSKFALAKFKICVPEFFAKKIWPSSAKISLISAISNSRKISPFKLKTKNLVPQSRAKLFFRKNRIARFAPIFGARVVKKLRAHIFRDQIFAVQIRTGIFSDRNSIL